MYLLLKDVDGQYVDVWGICNEEYSEGFFVNGILYFGFVLFLFDGMIFVKFVELGYRLWLDWFLVLD